MDTLKESEIHKRVREALRLIERDLVLRTEPEEKHKALRNKYRDWKTKPAEHFYARSDQVFEKLRKSYSRTEIAAMDDQELSSAVAGADPQVLSREDFDRMRDFVDAINAKKNDEGEFITIEFQRLVNKKTYPTYYTTIKEPVAISTINGKIAKKSYNSYEQFIRDFALMAHNAKLFNEPDAGIIDDTLALLAALKEELQKWVDAGIITAEQAVLPDFGTYSSSSEDEDDDDDDEEGLKSSQSGAKVSAGQDSQKKSVRPPKLLTPMEGRIHNMLKSIQKAKTEDGQPKITDFMKLPDKTEYPSYYQEIKQPVALDMIKRKAKRKQYHSVDEALADVELMFNNAMQYNEEGSAIWTYASTLRAEAKTSAESEKKKPDSDFVDDLGKIPLSQILHNGEVWKIGDWVHIANANDANKPIVAQIFRTYQDRNGQHWINACWYYRPEQTVHQFERHFWENEVLKSGLYVDHKIDEVKERCFVMFHTRYFKGRPADYPDLKHVYVCEARYNEDKAEINKIKTWTSCVPDEVREKDYVMNLFEVPRSMKKFPSPIKHLLREDAMEDDPLPKPTWGQPNCPPIVGAVHRRPPPPNQSPPPSPTPPPATQATIESARRPATERAVRDHSDTGLQNPYARAAPSPMPLSAGNHATLGQNYLHSLPSMSPAPLVHQNSYGSQGSASHSAVPQSYQQGSTFNQYTAMSPGAIAQPAMNYDSMRPQSGTYRPSTQGASFSGSSNVYNPPRQSETFTLHDDIDATIPADIRNSFPCDDEGRVLFFSKPPFVTADEDELELPARTLHEEAEMIRARKRKEAEDARKLKQDGLPKFDAARLAQLQQVLQQSGGRQMPSPELSKEYQSQISAKIALHKQTNPNYLKDAAVTLRKQVERRRELEAQAEQLKNFQERFNKSFVDGMNKQIDEDFKGWFGDKGPDMRALSDAQVAYRQAVVNDKKRRHEEYKKENAKQNKVPIWGYRTDGTPFGDAPPRRNA
ncbi:hypothetical protein BP5796_07219 [Coleophoma crateriformis]|uniref:Chromatin structure-remodeling complex protein rsc1 n=1 Tax=Coleophoma crateriformis TaxID=565419 RepID=A0A3D8RIA5_9HELO|nr:hypothetical protein BP5796_07219 [Coleophoma crateriformis]